MRSIQHHGAFDGTEPGWDAKSVFRFRCVLIVLMGFISVTAFGLFAACVYYVFSTGGEGSPAEAERMAAKLKSIESPDTSLMDDAEFSAHRFDNGEWMVALSRSSHAYKSKWRGGGTIVVKDSRGQVRSFMAHVCGENLPKVCAMQSKDLNGFYEFLRGQADFRESTIP
jgi:hypothetical protein